MLAGLFAIFVFIPANIYLELMTGQKISTSIFTMLLFVEMARLFGRKITRQEAFIISFLAGLGAFAPLDMVYRVYFRNADVVRAFGFSDLIPDWYVPPSSTGIQITRTFFHPAWYVPFALYLLRYVLALILSISIGLLLKSLYIDVQKLPFPLQQVHAQQIITISEGERSAVNLLFTAGLFGFIWGFIVYALPNVVKAYTGRYIRFVPIPWYDFATLIEHNLPGAMFGVATDLSPIISAFVLSDKMILSMIVGSYAVWVFGNYLIVKYNLALQPWWLPGMSSEFIYSRSTMYFWAVPLIGFSLAVGLMPVLSRPKRFLKSLSSISLMGSARVKYYILLGILVPTLLGILVYATLTDFPLYIAAPLFIFAPLVLSMVNSQMVGETGKSIDVDVPMNLIYYASGYPGVEVWFAPTLINVEGTGWLKNFKVAELTDTPIWDLIKARIMLIPVMMIAGFLFVQLFWSLAPIPSGVYPGAQIFWRVRAINKCIWIKGREVGLFNPYWLLASFVIGVAVYFIASMINVPAIGLAAGAHTTPHFATSLLIGLLLKMALRKYKGEIWWNKNRRLLAAGLGVGLSIAVTISVAVSLIITSIWTLPV